VLTPETLFFVALYRNSGDLVSSLIDLIEDLLGLPDTL